MISNLDKAKILVKALPFIKKYHSKTIVIKYGGSAMVNPVAREQFIQDIVLMKYVGINPVIVHGGGPEINEMLQKIGKERFPLQYLLNEQEFYGRKFYVNKGVLIPRQDTEVLVEEAIKILKKDKIQNPKILDIGTGSGVIGLTVALEIPDSKVMGTDISEKALEISEKNKKLLNVENIKFFKSNLFENIEYKKFDMIISNPPYISDNEIGVMSDEALFAENNGLFFYYEICRNGMNYLQNNGYLLFEIGYRQGEVVKEIVKKAGFKNVNIIKDMQNNDRVVAGQKQMEKNEV